MTILRTHHFDGTAGATVDFATEGFDNLTGTAPPVYQADGVSNTCARFTCDGTNRELDDTTASVLGAYRGFYLRIATAATTNGSRLMLANSGSHQAVAYLSIDTSSNLSICSPYSNVDTTASPLTVGTWYWISWHIDLAGSTQELRLYDVTKTTLIDTLTGACRPNGQTTFSDLFCGNAAPGGLNTGLVFDIDEVVIADDWPPLSEPTGPTVRGVIVGGVEAPATVRGVIVGGSEVAVTVKEIIGGDASPDVITFSDFAGSNTVGLDYSNTATSIVGAGINQTIYEMVPNTSTKASYVSGLTSGQTNQCRLIFAAGTDSSHVEAGLEFADFTVQGTEQGHIYNGLEIGYSTGANIHDIKILDIPGNDIAPPGETFSLNLWHVNSATVSNVTIDGGNIAATLCGLNNCDTITFTNCTFTNSGAAMCAACWQSKNITFDTCTFLGAQRGINIENPYGGFHTFKNCTFGKYTKPWQIVCQGGVWVAPNASVASTVLTIEDPVWNFATNGPFIVKHFPKASYPSNVQNDSDIHLVIGGVDVTSDTSKFQFTTAS